MPLLRAAVALGIGFGGLFDGIVFHQILQWHHMLSTPAPPDPIDALRLNTLADGIFHGAVWLGAVAGVWLLVRARIPPQRSGCRRVPRGLTSSGWSAAL